jgi:membrane fusion protein, multidrug efflux system
MLRKTILVLAIASALVACNKESKEPAKPGASAEAVAKKDGKGGKDEKPVTLLISPEDLLTVQTNALASGPVITGSIQPERKADLRAEVSAVVLQVLKENGDIVRKGDVLVRLDETAIRDSMMSAEQAARASTQALDQSERQLARMKTLRESGMTSAQAMDDAEVRRNNASSDLAAAKTRVAQARQQLQRTLVRAPFDGVVSERKVSADRITAVKIGQPVSFRING